MHSSDEANSKKLMVKCPGCGALTPFADNPFRPFCSRACKGGDLLNWSTGAYQIPGKPAEDEDNE